MSERRPYGPDGLSSRYADETTPASSHPELVSGDLAIPPRPRGSLMPVGSNVRQRFGMLAFFAVVALLSTMVARDGATSDTSDTERQSPTRELSRACMQWHLAAGAVVSRLLQSTRDADLVQVNDSVFRMRRARRNCEAGWVTLACQDYHAVVAATPGYAMTDQLFPCSRVAGFAYERD